MSGVWGGSGTESVAGVVFQPACWRLQPRGLSLGSALTLLPWALPQRGPHDPVLCPLLVPCVVGFGAATRPVLSLFLLLG